MKSKIRFKEISVIIVSDSGPLNPKSHIKQKAQNYMCTSLFFSGKNIFFWQKVFGHIKEGSSRFVLKQIDMSMNIPFPKENLKFIAPGILDDDNIQIFFA